MTREHVPHANKGNTRQMLEMLLIQQTLLQPLIKRHKTVMKHTLENNALNTKY